MFYLTKVAHVATVLLIAHPTTELVMEIVEPRDILLFATKRAFQFSVA